MRRLRNMMMVVGSLVALGGVAQGQDSRGTSRESWVTFRLATTVVTADFDRLAYNGEVLYVSRNSTFSSAEIRIVESTDAGASLELTLTREAASNLESAARRAQTDRLAVFVGSRIVAAPTIEVNDSDGTTVLGGFSSSVADRLVALLSREGVAYGGPVFSVFSEVTAARAGDVITVDAYVDGVSDLGAFQATLEVTGGTTGRIVIEDVQIDDARPDYVFDASAVKVTDQIQFRAAGVLMNGGVNAEEPVYVATYTLRVSPDASGTFNINVSAGEGSLLRDSNAMAIAYRPGKDWTITVGKSRTDRPTR